MLSQIRWEETRRQWLGSDGGRLHRWRSQVGTGSSSASSCFHPLRAPEFSGRAGGQRCQPAEAIADGGGHRLPSPNEGGPPSLLLLFRPGQRRRKRERAPHLLPSGPPPARVSVRCRLLHVSPISHPPMFMVFRCPPNPPTFLRTYSVRNAVCG